MKQFGTLPTLDGYAVICEDTGRTVAERDTLSSANGVAYKLNQAADTSSSALQGLLASLYSNPRRPE